MCVSPHKPATPSLQPACAFQQLEGTAGFVFLCPGASKSVSDRDSQEDECRRLILKNGNSVREGGEY